jgi:hypothetical protein
MTRKEDYLVLFSLGWWLKVLLAIEHSIPHNLSPVSAP